MSDGPGLPEAQPCDTCGNVYDQAFALVTADGTRYTFDSIECAAHRVAPVCEHCACRILGHGVQVGSAMYCCASCAHMSGAEAVVDRV